MCVVLALVHSSLNPGMTDCRGRVSSFLPQPQTACTSQSHTGECLSHCWRMCTLGNNSASTGKVVHIHWDLLQKGVQRLCVSDNIFVAFSQLFWILIDLLTSAFFFFWTCYTDLLLAMILLLCSGNDVDKHLSGGWCTLRARSLFLVLPTEQGTALWSEPLVTSSAYTLPGTGNAKDDPTFKALHRDFWDSIQLVAL